MNLCTTLESANKTKRKSNYKLQKKKERNRSNCKSYYPDEVEELAFGTATEEEQLALIDVTFIRKREDRIAKLYSIFPDEITFSWNKGRVEFSARIISLLCYAYGQGRTNVRSCLGSYYKRKGYQNLTVRRKNTGMVFVTNEYVERERQVQEIRKRAFEEEEHEKEKAEEEEKLKVKKKKQRNKAKVKPNHLKKRKLNHKKKKKKKLKIHFKSKQTKLSRPKPKTTVNEKKQQQQLLTKKILKTRTKSQTKNNSKNQIYEQKIQKIHQKPIITLGNDDPKNSISTNLLDQNSKYENDFFSMKQSNLFSDSFWEESTQNSNDLQSDLKRGFSPVNSPFLSEIQPENEIQQQYESVLPYQFDTEDFTNFIPIIENEFELSTLEFD
ncbi:protein dek [Anaeramoeba flamelloides]|uniref:Protein dek n=1 Tax=Anaeramoeba flamelloides TaxID=1746091 RepID=A0AAV8A9A4_9EUKA|nr:protein dek [Anaeramoeba flamelloides]